MNMPKDRTEVAVQVTTAAMRLLRKAGAFTRDALMPQLDGTGWRDDEVIDVLDVLEERGWVHKVTTEDLTDIYLPGARNL